MFIISMKNLAKKIVDAIEGGAVITKVVYCQNLKNIYISFRNPLGSEENDVILTVENAEQRLDELKHEILVKDVESRANDLGLTTTEFDDLEE